MPGGYIADAADGTGLTTPVSVVLPPDADGQDIVDVRVITTDAGGSDSMIGIDDIAIAEGATSTLDATINEVRLNKSGEEFDYVELIGAADQVLADATLLVLSGEFAPGAVEFEFDLSGTMPPDGFFVAGDAPDVPDVDLDTDADFFGAPSTFLLVSGFTGGQGDDYDTDDDGTLDSTPWTEVLDGVSFVDGDTHPRLQLRRQGGPGGWDLHHGPRLPLPRSAPATSRRASSPL